MRHPKIQTHLKGWPTREDSSLSQNQPPVEAPTCPHPPVASDSIAGVEV
jgi:hypothetical protein